MMILQLPVDIFVRIFTPKLFHIDSKQNRTGVSGNFSKMASKSTSAAKPANKKGPSHEQIVGGFQELRQQQKAVASKISELEMEKKEHE